MRVHHDWDTEGFALEPVAVATGPFARRFFLEALWEERPREELLLIEGDQALLALTQRDGTLEFAGEADLCDYHSPLGDGVADLVVELAADPPVPGPWLLDSLPVEAAEPIRKGLHAARVPTEVRQHTVAVVLDLPSEFDEYLHSIGKHQRHELRRKVRRYEVEVGPAVMETYTGDGWAFSEFVRLHRLAAGEKGGFFSPELERFFRRLAIQPGWQVDLLRAGSRATSAVFGYRDDTGYYLYNSGYDPAQRHAAPGMALMARLIEECINAGLPHLDFLKGNEAYKLRLGGKVRPLLAVEVNR